METSREIKKVRSDLRRSITFADWILPFTIFFVVLIPSRLQGQSESVLYSFKGGSDGSSPHAGLVRDHAGNLYGTTLYGGGSTLCPSGCGTIFKIARSGGETVLYGLEEAPTVRTLTGVSCWINKETCTAQPLSVACS